MDKRTAIGIHDLSFELTSVKDLVQRGVLERPIDGNHGEIHPKAEDFVAEGVPFIMASDLRAGGVDYVGCAHISERQAESLRKGFAKNGDVLLTHKATIGETALVDYEGHPYVMLTPQVTYYRVKDKKALSNRYLKHYFDSSLFQQTLRMLASSGSTRAYLGITEQQRLPVILPSPEKQEKIASILSAYDDLIANNQRRIALLESMAEEIYREWFVRMRFPGWALSATDKGIPANWSRKTIDSLIAESKRPIKKADLFTVDRYIGLEHIPRRTAVLDAWGQPDSVDSDKLRFSEGDILFGKIRPYLHKIAIAPFSGACSTDTIVLKPRHAEFLLFAYFTVSSETFVDLATVASKGTKMPRADWHFLKQVEITTPPDYLLKSFNAVAKPLIDSVATLLKMNYQLAESRDALLPRLLSGKLRVDQLNIQPPPSMRADTAPAV